MILLIRQGVNLALPISLTIEGAILRSVSYADVFDYALTLDELHRYLIYESISLDELRETLASSDWLAARVTQVEGVCVLVGREGLAAQRRTRAESSAQLWIEARRWGRRLAHLPFVRMAAVTGALAVNNSTAGDDIDFLLVTAPGRVWLARAFAIILVRLARLAQIKLCPNYVLAESALELNRRDLFVAHELAQMVPLSGLETYWRMRAANAWEAAYLPNARTAPKYEPDLAPRGVGRWAQRLAEWLLGGKLVDWLECWERDRKIARFKKQFAHPSPAAVLDESQVKGHFNDYGRDAIAAYADRCRQHQLPVIE
jgi:hypothetical protein